MRGWCSNALRTAHSTARFPLKTPRATTTLVVQRKIKGKPRRIELLFARFQTPLYLVSFNTRARRQILATPTVHIAFIKYSRRATEFGIIVGRYVIMPDHVHLFVCFGSGCTIALSEWIKGMKRQLSSALAESSVRPTEIPGQLLSSLWQPGFHDHLLRSSESYASKWNYVRENPVRAGLVEIAETWPYAGEIATIDRV
jgi:putative transposase